MPDTITSLQNSRIKFLFQLKEKSRIRKKENRFLIEGKREILLANQGGYTLNQLYYCPSIMPEDDFLKFISKISSEIDIVKITPEIYKKLAYRDTTEGILAVAVTKDLNIKNFNITNKNPLVLVAEAPEKPGNIGAILRTADAAKLDAVFIANPKTDMYNPNIIRSSIGCVFTNHIATGTTEEIISFLKTNNIHSYGAALQASEHYCNYDYRKPTAIIVGTEATGLSEQWLSSTSKNIKIPMDGVIDSMNVSVAAGILIFEAKRQREYNN